MFFGLGSWITPKQLNYFQSVYIAMLKKGLRVGQVALPAKQVIAKANAAEVRVRLAVERLLYAQRLFRTGPSFLHHLLPQEFGKVAHSWFHGLRADARWMNGVLPDCLPTGWDKDMT